jgi:hypothetical protein
VRATAREISHASPKLSVMKTAKAEVKPCLCERLQARGTSAGGCSRRNDADWPCRGGNLDPPEGLTFARVLLASGNHHPHHPAARDVAPRATITPHSRPMAAQAPGDVSGPLENIRDGSALLLWAYRAAPPQTAWFTELGGSHRMTTKQKTRAAVFAFTIACTGGRQRANQGLGRTGAFS